MRQTESKRKKGEKKRETWTFQPSPDVIALVQELGISTKNRGERTKLVNEAMRMAAKRLGASERAATCPRTMHGIGSRQSQQQRAFIRGRATAYATPPRPTGTLSKARSSRRATSATQRRCCTITTGH